MKLTLKELAPYTPYGLKMKKWFHTHRNEELKFEIVKVKGVVIGKYGLEVHSSCSGFSNSIDKHQPILRPLSYLTKYIEYNGERFIPFDELMKYSDYEDYLDMVIQDKYELNTPVRWPYELVQKLFEWHFDLFGLIEKGLAIDINEI